MNDFDPDKVTVGMLFKDDRRLVIPRFQRSYEWREANIEEFYNDFVRTTGDSLNFLGNIVLDASTPGIYQVIDGQQRLITLTILCATIRDILREDIHSPSAYDLASKIESTYLQSGVTFSDTSDSIFKLTPSRELEEFFYTYIQIGGETARKTLSRTTSHKNVINAYKKFRKMLSEEKLSSNADNEDKVKFLQMTMDKIHRVNLITISIYKPDAAYAIFESFNAKQVDLSVSDLVKNYYFSKLKGNEVTLDSNMDRWDKVVTRITAILGARVDRFLHYYLQSMKGKFTRAQLYRELRIIIDAGPERFIKNLERATDVYMQLKDSNVQLTSDYPVGYEYLNRMNNSLDGINRFNVEQCFILLMAIFLNKQKLTPAYITKIIETLESFTFTFSKITNGQANVLESIYGDFAKEISNIDKPKDVNVFSGQFYSRLKKKLSEVVPRYESFEAEFTELDYSNPQQKRLIMYIFEKTEEFNTRGGSVLGQLANIDHIFPQNTKVATRPSRYNKIGNLLPIDRDTNSKVGNKLPSEKISIYESVKNITQIADYLSFTKEHGLEMTNELIDIRAKQLSKHAYDQVWQFDK